MEFSHHRIKPNETSLISAPSSYEISREKLMERLCNSTDVAEGEVRQVVLGDGRVLAVYRVDGAVFATDDLCSHGDASLADGEIEDGRIVCPYHLGSFCIRTGEPTGAPCAVPIRAYKVVEVDDGIMLIG